MSRCVNLNSIVLSSGVFSGCSSLYKVTLPSHITKIDTGAFEDCTALKNITLPSGVLFIGENAFRNSGITTLNSSNCVDLSTIPHIDGWAFYSCDNIEVVKFSRDPECHLKDSAFELCSNLTTIYLSKNTTLGNHTFRTCLKLNTIYFDGSEDDWEKYHNQNDQWGL